ncbi:MAG TPA: MerR family transcriptional regulator [Phototrophicaceae bacterium]|nr:MerR family transcriptional regulator [Phototrophicaceae bacterium]
MFKIGDFSRLTQVPVSALRYYDELGLLKPAQIDRFTGYRYYSLDQLPRLNRILALKDLGLSLEQIAQLLDDNLTPEQIRGMFRLKQAELQQQVRAEQARLLRVETHLKQIEAENQMPAYEVVLKALPGQRVLALRQVVPTTNHVGLLHNEVERAICDARIPIIAPVLSIYHDEDFKAVDVDVEIVYPVAAEAPAALELADGSQLVKREIPPFALAATTIHRGAYQQLGPGYTAIGQWIEANGYQIIGAVREVYLKVSSNETEAITEIQFPVAKVE